MEPALVGNIQMKLIAINECAEYGKLKPFDEKDRCNFKHITNRKIVVSCQQCLKYCCRVEVKESK